jgi:anti-sigma factor RsiW
VIPPGHVAAETLAAYWARELSDEDQEQLERHVFECDACAAAWQRAAAASPCLRELVRGIIP